MIANYHTHTWRCAHAAPDEEAYVLAAMDRGLKLLGFSDHSPYTFPSWYRSTFRMGLHQLEDYVNTVLSLREQYRGRIDIHLGLEMEYYPDFVGQLLPILRDTPMEYVILGQHFVGSEIGESYCGAPTADASLLKRYCAQTMDAMNTGLYTYFAHPDVMHFVGSRQVYRQQMRQLCREAKSCGLPLEINLLGLAEGRHYPDRDFWRIAGEEGCKAIIGCDAHTPAALLDVTAEEMAMDMAEAFGLEVLPTVELRRL